MAEMESEKAKAKAKDCSNLAQSINLVSAMIPSLFPDGHNVPSGYAYISADKVYEVVGQAMAEHGVVVVPGIHNVKVDTVETTNKNGSMIRRFDASLAMEMTILGEDGAMLKTPWAGYGVDYQSGDKAVACAATTAMSYFLKMLFLVGKGNPDGEHQVPPGTETSESARSKKQVAQRKRDAPRETSDVPQSYSERPSDDEASSKSAMTVVPTQVTAIKAVLDNLSDKSEWNNWLASTGWGAVESIPASAYTEVVTFLKVRVAREQARTQNAASGAGQKQQMSTEAQAFLKELQAAKPALSKQVMSYIEEQGIQHPAEMSSEQIAEARRLLTKDTPF